MLTNLAISAELAPRNQNSVQNFHFFWRNSLFTSSHARRFSHLAIRLWFTLQRALNFNFWEARLCRSFSCDRISTTGRPGLYPCCHTRRVQPHVDNPLHPLSRALNCTPGWLAKFLLSPVPFFDFWATKSSFSSFRVPFLDFWAVAHMIFGYNPSIMTIYRELC